MLEIFYVFAFELKTNKHEMSISTKILMSVPGTVSTGRYFSLRLKQEVYNEPPEYQQAEKILVVSNIEGNFHALRSILVRNAVVNRKYEWIFGNGHLVIVGNCFDRDEQMVECLWLIYSLEERARRMGGYVHFILGNHEIVSLNGHWCDLQPKYALGRESGKASTTVLYDGNNEIWRWLLTKNIMEKIGSTLFVHGGIAPEINQVPLSIYEINRLAKRHYTQAEQIFTEPVLNHIFHSEKSPFSYCGYYQGKITEEQINDTLDKFGVETIVTGHTLVDHIYAYYSKKVININTNHAGGHSEVLFIKGKRFYCIDKNGKRTRLK